MVTLAALVEKETAQDAERPLVAAVYRNRHRIGMPMQADPTVIYALQRAGRWNGNLTRDDLAFDSPYNTYRVAGLPPGPIAAPGRRALEAVVQPAAVDYLYFVSRNDGTHVFATTLAEHNRNVYEWQIRYFREKRTDRVNSRCVDLRSRSDLLIVRSRDLSIDLQLARSPDQIADRPRDTRSSHVGAAHFSATAPPADPSRSTRCSRPAAARRPSSRSRTLTWPRWWALCSARCSADRASVG